HLVFLKEMILQTFQLLYQGYTVHLIANQLVFLTLIYPGKYGGCCWHHEANYQNEKEISIKCHCSSLNIFNCMFTKRMACCCNIFYYCGYNHRPSLELDAIVRATIVYLGLTPDTLSQD